MVGLGEFPRSFQEASNRIIGKVMLSDIIAQVLLILHPGFRLASFGFFWFRLFLYSQVLCEFFSFAMVIFFFVSSLVSLGQSADISRFF